jgi:hypothetical protein
MAMIAQPVSQSLRLGGYGKELYEDEIVPALRKRTCCVACGIVSDALPPNQV